MFKPPATMSLAREIVDADNEKTPSTVSARKAPSAPIRSGRC